ncbi:MAG: hypothetical protein J4400_00995 [Candidatus Aenigmarchaeota archaeon]|nr:hypothetical protein [Candidatus Aenigmarchaeota archaeon]
MKYEKPINLDNGISERRIGDDEIAGRCVPDYRDGVIVSAVYYSGIEVQRRGKRFFPERNDGRSHPLQ